MSTCKLDASDSLKFAPPWWKSFRQNTINRQTRPVQFFVVLVIRIYCTFCPDTPKVNSFFMHEFFQKTYFCVRIANSYFHIFFFSITSHFLLINHFSFQFFSALLLNWEKWSKGKSFIAIGKVGVASKQVTQEFHLVDKSTKNRILQDALQDCME